MKQEYKYSIIGQHNMMLVKKLNEIIITPIASTFPPAI